MCLTATVFSSTFMPVAISFLIASLEGVAFPSNNMCAVTSFLARRGFSSVLLLLLPFYLTFIAYSPFTLMPIFFAISDFSASITAILLPVGKELVFLADWAL